MTTISSAVRRMSPASVGSARSLCTRCARSAMSDTGPALEVAIAEPRDLAHEQVAEPLLERARRRGAAPRRAAARAPAAPPAARRRRRTDAARRAIEQRAEQHRLDDGARAPPARPRPPAPASARRPSRSRRQSVARRRARAARRRRRAARAAAPRAAPRRAAPRPHTRSSTAPRMVTCALPSSRGRRRRRGRVRRRAPARRPVPPPPSAPPAPRPAGAPRAPRATAPAVDQLLDGAHGASSAAIGGQPGSASARAISAPPSAIRSARIRRASGAGEPVAAGPLAERRPPAAPSRACRRRAGSVARRTQRRPRAGSITCTQPPCTRHTTTKWVSPDGSRTPRCAGSASASAQQQVIDRHHHLLGVEAQALRQRLQRVDRRAVDRRLAGLAQAAVADADAEPLEQALERGRARSPSPRSGSPRARRTRSGDAATTFRGETVQCRPGGSHPQSHDRADTRTRRRSADTGDPPRTSGRSRCAATAASPRPSAPAARALAGYRAIEGPRHADVANALVELGLVLEARDRLREARPLPAPRARASWRWTARAIRTSRG